MRTVDLAKVAPAVKVGMTYEEVVKAAGKPSMEDSLPRNMKSLLYMDPGGKGLNVLVKDGKVSSVIVIDAGQAPQ